MTHHEGPEQEQTQQQGQRSRGLVRGVGRGSSCHHPPPCALMGDHVDQALQQRHVGHQLRHQSCSRVQRRRSRACPLSPLLRGLLLVLPLPLGCPLLHVVMDWAGLGRGLRPLLRSLLLGCALLQPLLSCRVLRLRRLHPVPLPLLLG
jgi:hypothetical protein